MADTLNDIPEDIGMDEDRLYNMSMEELEAMLYSKDLEQPDEDSDVEEETEESDETEEEVEESDTESEGEPEEAEASLEDNPEAEKEKDEDDQPTEKSTDEDDKSKPQTVETYKVKAVGTEVEFTLDELKELASKGLDYTKKMQEIAPWKKQIAMMKEHKVSKDDINLLIDLKSGNKGAILSLMKDNGIDRLDVDMDEINYRPRDYSTPDSQLALRETVSRLALDRDVYPRTERVVDVEWDAVSRSKLLAEPTMIEGLHNDIKSGLYDKVMPTALKLKALDGGTKSDLDYYIEAGRRYMETATQQVNQQTEVKRKSHQEDIDKNSQRRKAASLPKSKAGQKKDIINYLDEIPDEDYHKWLKKVESQF